MYGDGIGGFRPQPSASELAQSRCVSGTRLGIHAHNAAPSAMATVLARRFLLHGQSSTVIRNIVHIIVDKATDFALDPTTNPNPLIVGDEDADGTDPNDKSADETRHHVIKTEVGKRSTYVIQVGSSSRLCTSQRH